MFIVMQGAMADKPFDYGTVDAYLDSTKEWLEIYVNDYLSKYHPEMPAFVLSDEFREFFKEYLPLHAKEQYAENPDGSFDYWRINNLCISAAADFLHI